MRYGRGIAAMAVVAVLMAPAAAVGIGGPIGDRSEAAKAEASSLFEASGALLTSWFERLTQALSAAWAETRGTIVPGGAGTTTMTTFSEPTGGG